MQTPPTRWTRWLPLLYLVFGVAWILGSDAIVGRLFKSDPQLLRLAGTVTGLVFVALTALLLAWWWRDEQRHAQRRLQTADERADLVAQQLEWTTQRANDTILLLDADGKIVDCNECAELMYGYSRAELLALDVFKLYPADSAGLDQAGDQFRTLQSTGRMVFEAVHQRRDGSTFPVEISSSPSVSAARTYIQSIVRDISKRKELERARQAAETALHESETRHRRRVERQRDLYELLSRCNHAVARVDDKIGLYESIVRLSVETGGFLFAWIGELRDDGAVAKVARFGDDDGYVEQAEISARADEPAGQGPVGRCLRDEGTVVINRFLESASTSPWHELARLKGVRSSATVPIRSQGKVSAALTLYSVEDDFFAADIVATLEEMAAEVAFGLDGLHLRAQLAESRNLLQAVIDASVTPIYAFDRQGRALFMNQACARLFNRTSEQLIGGTRELLRAPEDAAAHEAFDRQVFESGESITVEERLRDGGSDRVFLSVKFPLRSVDGTITSVGGVSTEITELRRAQEATAALNARLEETVAKRTEELVAARDRAQQADRAKTAFLSTVSHELRTPLNSIIGFTDVVVQGLAGPLTDEQSRQLRIVQDSARMLLDLINEILDLSRIETGRLPLVAQDFDLADLLRRKVEGLAAQAATKGLQLQADVATNVGRMTSDPKRVAQIVSNLLSNAVKFTERGSVALRAQADGDLVVIVVQDTGPGIGVDDLARLFKPFVQLGRSGSQQQGTGLGLAISRHLARALGGDISVHSTPGQGSRFELTLPVVLVQPDETGSTTLNRKIVPGS